MVKQLVENNKYGGGGEGGPDGAADEAESPDGEYILSNHTLLYTVRTARIARSLHKTATFKRYDPYDHNYPKYIFMFISVTE